MSKPKYLADLHISPITCELLRKAGYYTIRVTDIFPSTASDQQIIKYARKQNMVIITQDLDFSALLAVTNDSKPSVVSLRLSAAEPKSIAGLLFRILPMLEIDLEKGAIISVTEQRIRIRPLPIH